MNPCDDCNLTSVARKNTLVQLCRYFSVQIETENYKLIYELQFTHFIKWCTIWADFGTF